MYSLIFRNRLPGKVEKFADLIKEDLPYTMEVGGLSRRGIDEQMAGYENIVFAVNADRHMMENLSRMFLNMETDD